MTKNIPELTESTFLDHVAHGVVLADFWAPWCGPCRMQTPILESLAQKTADPVSIAKVNVDTHPALAEQLGVQSIPTLVLFKNGQEVQRFVGVQPENTLAQAIEQVQS